MDRAADDSDLTNLNWVSGAEAPMNYSLSPPSSSRDNYLLQKQNQIAIECKKRGLCPYVDSYGNKRPTCSYSCLTALALKAATITDSGACLPVQEIYSCIEELFPFYKNVEGWKNSVRHNLSLNPCFRKMLHEEGWEGKKGYFWEINPEHLEKVNKELFRYLNAERFSLDEMRAILLRKWTKPSPQLAKIHKRKQVATPPREKPAEVLRDPSEVAIYSPEMRKQLIKMCRILIKAKTDQTNKVFDASNKPSEFAGIHTPQTDDIGAAKELFNSGSTSETNSPCPLYKTTNHGEIIPFSTTPIYSIYGYPTVGYGYGTPSPINGVSPVSPGGATPCMTPPFMPLVPVAMFPPYVMDVNGQPNTMFACQKCGHQNSPMISPGSTCDTEDPLENSNGDCSCKGTKRKKTTTAKKTANKKPKTTKCTRKLKFNEESSNVSSSSPPKKKGRPPKKAATKVVVQNEDSYVEVESDNEDSIDHFSSLSSTSKTTGFYDRDFQGLSEEIQEAEGLVGNTSDMSLNDAMRARPYSKPAFRSQVIRRKPFKAVSVLDCVSPQESSADESEHKANGGRIPALNSLLDLGDASIVGITKAMNMD